MTHIETDGRTVRALYSALQHFDAVKLDVGANGITTEVVTENTVWQQEVIFIQGCFDSYNPHWEGTFGLPIEPLGEIESRVEDDTQITMGFAGAEEIPELNITAHFGDVVKRTTTIAGEDPGDIREKPNIPEDLEFHGQAWTTPTAFRYALEGSWDYARVRSDGADSEDLEVAAEADDDGGVPDSLSEDCTRFADALDWDPNDQTAAGSRFTASYLRRALDSMIDGGLDGLTIQFGEEWPIRLVGAHSKRGYQVTAFIAPRVDNLPEEERVEE